MNEHDQKVAKTDRICSSNVFVQHITLAVVAMKLEMITKNHYAKCIE